MGTQRQTLDRQTPRRQRRGGGSPYRSGLISLSHYLPTPTCCNGDSARSQSRSPGTPQNKLTPNLVKKNSLKLQPLDMGEATSVVGHRFSCTCSPSSGQPTICRAVLYWRWNISGNLKSISAAKATSHVTADLNTENQYPQLAGGMPEGTRWYRKAKGRSP